MACDDHVRNFDPTSDSYHPPQQAEVHAARPTCVRARAVDLSVDFADERISILAAQSDLLGAASDRDGVSFSLAGLVLRGWALVRYVKISPDSPRTA